MVFLEEEEWHTPNKTEYYLAQIAAEIRVIREGFSKNPKAVAVNDLLLKFGEREQSQVTTQNTVFDQQQPMGGIEIGPDAIKDPKWAATNTMAKSMWAARLGLDPSKIGTPNGSHHTSGT